MSKFLSLYDNGILLNLDHVREIYDLGDKGVKIEWSSRTPMCFPAASMSEVRKQMEELGVLEPQRID